MPKLDTETEEEFVNRIKSEFKYKLHDLILIEDGGFFIGGWNQLDDCFFLSPEELPDFCSDNNLKYEVIYNSC